MRQSKKEMTFSFRPLLGEFSAQDEIIDNWLQLSRFAKAEASMGVRVFVYPKAAEMCKSVYKEGGNTAPKAKPAAALVS